MGSDFHPMSSIPNDTKGVVYVLSSASMAIATPTGEPEFLYKVGATTSTPFERARQLTAATAAAVPFSVVHYRPCEDVNDAEARCHERLDEFRVNEAREFFQAPLLTIIRVVDEVTGYGEPVVTVATPFADLFATFPDDGSGRPLNEAEQAQCRALEAKHTLTDSTARR